MFNGGSMGKIHSPVVGAGDLNEYNFQQGVWGRTYRASVIE